MKYYADYYRSLEPIEINLLEKNQCSSDDWSRVKVSGDNIANYCKSVHFSGDVFIAGFGAIHSMPGGVTKKSGLYNAHIHNCSLDKNVLIENISEYIANYNIGENTIIINVDRLLVSSESSFGNGTEVSVLNETGGREVVITHNISAQTAYLMAFYRHNKALISSLQKLIQKEVDKFTSNEGSIGANVLIRGAKTIENVYIGDNAYIDGVSLLSNGSIMSNEYAPVKVANNVNAVDFILLSGSQLLDGTTISHSLLGQGARLSHLFSAHDSLFFANCNGENGEACAVFAGPYTTTMHKSSLLIAGYYSFLNAGSGSNQSNHLYKLGPIHQGIVERGSKTTSDSYVLWPSHIGAFTLVMGRHVDHIDSSDFPFSYLIEDHNDTYLAPAINLRSIGTIRDAKKWPDRDKRKDITKLDNINFNLLSPYTVGRMIKGYRILSKLNDMLGNATNQKLTYRNMRIRQSALDKGIKLYRMAIVKFLGNSIIHKLGFDKYDNDIALRERLNKGLDSRGLGDWIDLCGLIAPQKEILDIIKKIENEKIESLDELNNIFTNLHKEYYDLEWHWAYKTLLEWFSIDSTSITRKDVCDIIDEWEKSVVDLDKMLYEDARKEFTVTAKVGFGLDSKDDNKEADFESVRGVFETNPVVQSVLDHIAKKKELGRNLKNRLL